MRVERGSGGGGSRKRRWVGAGVVTRPEVVPVVNGGF